MDYMLLGLFFLILIIIFSLVYLNNTIRKYFNLAKIKTVPDILSLFYFLHKFFIWFIGTIIFLLLTNYITNKPLSLIIIIFYIIFIIFSPPTYEITNNYNSKYHNILFKYKYGLLHNYNIITLILVFMVTFMIYYIYITYYKKEDIFKIIENNKISKDNKDKKDIKK